jgi:dihydrofolate reductase
MPILTLLVARALNGAFGNANRLPWHLPEDLAHFKRTTMGGIIVMGRRTWESIGRVLPGRQMVVVTRGEPPLPVGVRRAASLEQAITDHAGERELFIIGGAQLIASAMPLAHRIILTEVELAPPGDVFFAQPDPAHWLELSRASSTSVTGIRYSIIIYERRRLPTTGAALEPPSLGGSSPQSALESGVSRRTLPAQATNHLPGA